MTKSDINKKALLKALEESLGVVTVACKKVGITRKTHYEYYKNDENYKTAVDDLSNVALDFAEARLHKLIKDENPTAIIFYLKTKGKERGYVERQEIQQTEPTRIIFENTSTKYTIDENGNPVEK